MNSSIAGIRQYAITKFPFPYNKKQVLSFLRKKKHTDELRNVISECSVSRFVTLGAQLKAEAT